MKGMNLQEQKKCGILVTVIGLVMFAIGFVTAFVVAYASIVWFLKFLNKSSLASFAYYRFVVAVIAAWYFYM